MFFSHGALHISGLGLWGPGRHSKMATVISPPLAMRIPAIPCVTLTLKYLLVKNAGNGRISFMLRILVFYILS